RNNRSSSNNLMIQDDIQSSIINISSYVLNQELSIFKSNNESVNRLEYSNEFEGRLESYDRLEDELGKSDNRFENRLEWDNESKKELKSNNNSLLTTNITSTTESEESILFISSEIAILIRFLKVKVQNNLFNKAFHEIIEAVVTKPISLYLIKKTLLSLIPFKPK
ncbi:3067_t:CDS:2, partial [Scutellospora calospora]